MDSPFEGVDVTRLAGVLVPGGDVRSVVEDEALRELLAAAHDRGCVLGAICAGPLLLARAGVLVGRAYTQAGRCPPEAARRRALLAGEAPPTYRDGPWTGA